MALNYPPVQEKTTDAKTGFFPQVWIRWFNDLSRFIRNYTSWYDYNNAGSAQSHTGGGTTYLTNDGAGAFSNSYNLGGFGDIWDATNNQFDFSELVLGDIVFIRVDTVVETSANNQEFDFILDMAIGSGIDYSLNMRHSYHKAIKDYPFTFVYEIYMGNTETINFPAKIRFASDDDAIITVNGWYARVTRL